MYKVFNYVILVIMWLAPITYVNLYIYLVLILVFFFFKRVMFKLRWKIVVGTTSFAYEIITKHPILIVVKKIYRFFSKGMFGILIAPIIE